MLNSVYVYFITNGGSFVIPFINKDKASQSWEFVDTLSQKYDRNTNYEVKTLFIRICMSVNHNIIYLLLILTNLNNFVSNFFAFSLYESVGNVC